MSQPKCDCAAGESANLVLHGDKCALAKYARGGGPESARDFYEKYKTNVVNVPRPGHPEDKSGWDGVHKASPAEIFAKGTLVMSLGDAFDFAEAYAKAAKKL